METIQAFNIIHEYDCDDDWNGNCCGYICIGCGACDHISTNFSFMQYVKKYEYWEKYYCRNCYIHSDTSIEQKYIRYNSMKNKNDDINIYQCNTCKKKYLLKIEGDIKCADICH